MRAETTRRVGGGGAAALVAVGALSVVVALFGRDASAETRSQALSLIPLVAAGVLLLWQRPSLPLSWAMGIHAFAWSVALLEPVLEPLREGGTAWAGILDRSISSTWPLMFPLLPVILTLFPEAPTSRRGQLLLRTELAAIAATMVAFAAHADEEGPAWLFHLSQVTLILLLICAVLAVARLIRARRHATGRRRSQISLVLAAGLAVVSLYVVGGLATLAFGSGGDSTIVSAFFTFLVIGATPTAIAIALLRHNLYEVDLAVNRAMVWGGLVILTIGVAVIVTELVARLIGRDAPDPLLVIIPCTVVAVAAIPLRRVLQRGADALLPATDDDRAAFRSLTRRLEAAVPVAGIPALIAEGVGEGLALDAVQVVEDTEDGQQVVGTWGDQGTTEAAESIQLRHAGAAVGQLLVWPQPDERQRELLRGLAGHAAAALQASRLTRDLQRSRERLVWGREEERRRLRQDLHDELSPSLAGIRLAVAAARSRGVPDDSDPLLARAEDEAADAVQVIRRILDDLRPPALDELGLVGAVRKKVESLAAPGAFEVFVTASDLPATLPPAVEVGLYRVASEATANAARHSGGRRCDVDLSRVDGALQLVVSDDGSGLPSEYRSGVGLRSMRERAEALGGTLSTMNGPAGGLIVTAIVPIASPAVSAGTP